MPITVTAELRRAALQEMARPTMAFDVIRLDGDPGERVNTGRNHPLAWILEAPVAAPAAPEAAPYFQELARRVRDELRTPSGKFGGNAATRRHLARLVGLAQDEVACPTTEPAPTWPTIRTTRPWPRGAAAMPPTRRV